MFEALEYNVWRKIRSGNNDKISYLYLDEVLKYRPINEIKIMDDLMSLYPYICPNVLENKFRDFTKILVPKAAEWVLNPFDGTSEDEYKLHDDFYFICQTQAYALPVTDWRNGFTRCSHDICVRPDITNVATGFPDGFHLAVWNAVVFENPIQNLKFENEIKTSDFILASTFFYFYDESRAHSFLERVFMIDSQGRPTGREGRIRVERVFECPFTSVDWIIKCAGKGLIHKYGFDWFVGITDKIHSKYIEKRDSMLSLSTKDKIKSLEYFFRKEGD
jgi:hypothetical protein